MKKLQIIPIVFITVLLTLMASANEMAGKATDKALMIVKNGKSDAIIVVSPKPGEEEGLAAQDLAKYIRMISGATVEIANTPEKITKALKSKHPLFIIGSEALKADPSLSATLKKAVTRKKILRSDAILLRRKGNRVYLAGSNDKSHYYAVAELLRLWGCRWYMPTQFGEVVPEYKRLSIGKLDYTYAPPFEIRTYWLSWVGDATGREEFQRRNFMLTGRKYGMPSTGHAIGKYVKGLGKSVMSIPLTDPKTAEHVASKVDKMFAEGKDFSLGMEDGIYASTYPKDQELMKLQWDKYYMRWSVSDPFLELYNNIARILQARYPDSKSKIGFLAYANMTIPPVRDMKAERSLFCELAPIDIDPIHSMDSMQSPPKQEYKEFLYKWAKVMDGRLAIYDYDQGMLVWRDIPNPSHMAFAQDVKHYRDAGILGINTESRNATATIFTNLYFRGQLMWNPDANVAAMLEEFYQNFYGPAAEPMGDYWNAIYKAWEDTIVTEHEHFIAPAIYTPELLALMNAKMKEAESLIAPLKIKSSLTRNEKLYLERIKFTRLSCDLANLYIGMVKAAATDLDYKKAAALGRKGLDVREQLTAMNGTFTTYKRKNSKVYGMPERGPAWWPGEVEQYQNLLKYTNGEKGKLLAKLPLEWEFRRDPENIGIKEKFATQTVDLTYWNENRENYTLDSRKDYPSDQWEMLRTDLYMQAQGIRHEDRQSYVKPVWYRTEVEIPAGKLKEKLHILFPGLFSEATLYINGKEVAQRKQGKLWWQNDYRFEWDVDLSGKLKPGKNIIALQVDCVHHMGGMFRRPFIYTLFE